jgi:transcription initiation factor TFIIIB Brf1 subunit/transcription initiation factor TFIIB
VTEIPACKHEKSRLIAKDNDAEYIECTACGAILETHELADSARTPNAEASKPAPSGGPEAGKFTPFDESLSDA